MLANPTTLPPGLILRGCIVRVDPAVDQIYTVDGEVWTRDATSTKWLCGPRWKDQDFIVNQITKGAWVRRKPR